MITRDEQKQLVADISAAIQHKVMTAISMGVIPAEWDGHELREYLADLYAFERTRLMREDRRRRREYKSAVLSNNL